MAKVYGIDLGTTYSVISTLDDNGMPEIVVNQDEGSNLLASAVYFQEGGDPVVGEVAKNQKDIEPERVVEFVKRYIGKPDAPTYDFDGVTYDPITISSLILKRMKEYANAQGHDVKDVVITCPAYFGNEERAATKQAGLIAGLNVLNIVNEPTAAALNYCCREFKESRKIMVYDLGGGTFDITLFDFSVDENGKALIDIIETGGNDRLGGIDWDARMYDYMCEKYAFENGVSQDDMEVELQQKIKAQIEQAKKDLSTLQKKSYTISYDGDRTRIELTREDFESRTQDLVEQTMDFVNHLLEKTGFSADNVDVVLLVGGSTKMPMVRAAVEAMFPGKVRVEDPDLAVAKGAALAAALEWNERLQTIASGGEVKPDYPTNDEEEPISNLPTTAEEAAALMINVPQQVSTVSDKLTRSLGPAVYVDEEHYMIDNLLFVGDEIPAEAEAVYGTRTDNQAEIKVKVFENVATDRENKHVLPSIDENGNEQYTDPALKVKMIGEVRLELPPNTLKGTPIRVVFRSSAIGLEVTATNLETDESAKTTITTANTMSSDELDEARARFASIKTSGQI
jgi:cell division protein ftsA